MNERGGMNMDKEMKLFEGKKMIDLGREDLKPRPKTGYYLTRTKIRDDLKKIIQRIANERMPFDIGELIVYGSYIKGKEKPNDLDALVTDAQNKERRASYIFGHECFRLLLGMEEGQWNYGLICWLFDYGHGHLISQEYITSKLLRMNMKNVHIQYQKDLSEFIRSMAINDDLQENGLPFDVIWSSSWVEGAEMKCRKQHPLTPYIRHLHLIENTQVFEAFDLPEGCLKKYDALIKKQFDETDSSQYQKTVEYINKINKEKTTWKNVSNADKR
jgi:hypothetical protein